MQSNSAKSGNKYTKLRQHDQNIKYLVELFAH
jgi:hypothetical protein